MDQRETATGNVGNLLQTTMVCFLDLVAARSVRQLPVVPQVYQHLALSVPGARSSNSSQVRRFGGAGLWERLWRAVGREPKLQKRWHKAGEGRAAGSPAFWSQGEQVKDMSGAGALLGKGGAMGALGSMKQKGLGWGQRMDSATWGSRTDGQWHMGQEQALLGVSCTCS